MVTGDHFDRDAGLVAGAHGLDRLRAGRVNHALQAQEGQVVHIRHCNLIGAGKLFTRKRQHAQTPRSHIIHSLLE